VAKNKAKHEPRLAAELNEKDGLVASFESFQGMDICVDARTVSACVDAGGGWVRFKIEGFEYKIRSPFESFKRWIDRQKAK